MTVQRSAAWRATTRSRSSTSYTRPPSHGQCYSPGFSSSP